MELLKKVYKRIKPSYIQIADLIYLNELLKTNMPIKTALELLKNNTNAPLFNSLITKLDKGLLIEEIIKDYLPKEISDYMKNLLNRLSFKESLALALSFYSKNKENIKSLEKAITYPIVLLFLSLTALYIFDSYGLDSILNLMNSFDVNTNSFEIIRMLIRIVVYVFYISFIVVALIFLIFINKKRITLFYILVSKYMPNSFITTFFTEDFVSLFILTLDLGYKTKDALMILKGLKNKPLISFLAFHLDNQLLEGNSLEVASKQKYFDELLSKYVNVASYSKDFGGVLNSYAVLAKTKITNKMKTYTTILQIFSYFTIGMVIVFIYQVLFLPMQAIYSF